jgi:hypothetical protein
MLSEPVLREFVRRVPSSKILVKKAWSSLALESKLQILDAYSKDSFQESNQTSEYNPDWLLNLALDDDEEIVRIFAAYKHGVTCVEPDEISQADSFYSQIEIDLAKEIQGKLQKDKSEIVKNLEHDNFFINITSIPQDCRLINIRGLKWFCLINFINSIERFASELSKEDLIELLDEIEHLSFLLPGIQSLNKAWKLLPELDEDYAFRLAKIIPIKDRRKSLWVEQEVASEIFLNLPPLALFWTLKTNKECLTGELKKVVKIINNEQLGHYDDYLKELALEIIREENFYSETDINNSETDINISGNKLIKFEKYLANFKDWLFK